MPTLKQDAMIVAGIGLGVVVIAWYLKSKVSDAVEALPEIAADVWDASVYATRFVDPTKETNVFNVGATGIYRWMTGSQGTIGGDLYDYVHKAQPAPGGNGTLTNYTDEQRRRDEEAMRRLERGYHGM